MFKHLRLINNDTLTTALPRSKNIFLCFVTLFVLSKNQDTNANNQLTSSGICVGRWKGRGYSSMILPHYFLHKHRGGLRKHRESELHVIP